MRFPITRNPRAMTLAGLGATLLLIFAACGDSETETITEAASSSTQTGLSATTDPADSTTTAVATATSAPTATTVPVTVAPTTVPATTAVPTTAAAPTTTVAATTTTILYAAGEPAVAPPASLPGSGGASGSGCSPGAGDLPDGVWFGSVVDRSAGSVEFDLACIYFLDAATAECSEDGEPVDNDYCVTNENPTLRTVAVGADVPVHTVVSGASGLELVPMPFAEWPPAEQADTLQVCHPDFCLVWLYVNGGEVTEVVEQYTP